MTQLVGSWPYWEQYRARRDELEQAEASGPRLSSDHLRTVTAAVARLDQIDGEIRKENTTAENAQRERSGLAVDENLLAVQPAIDTLGRDKPGADTARARATQLGGEAASVRAELSELLGRLGLHDIDEPAGGPRVDRRVRRPAGGPEQLGRPEGPARREPPQGAASREGGDCAAGGC